MAPPAEARRALSCRPERAWWSRSKPDSPVSPGQQSSASFGLTSTVRSGTDTSCRSQPSDISRQISTRSRAAADVMKWYRENVTEADAAVSAFLEANGFAGVNSRGHRRCFTRSWYPLHCAVRQGNADMAALLLQRAADASLQDSAGRTALQYALHKDRKGGHGALVSLLERHGGAPRQPRLLGRESGGAEPFRADWEGFLAELSSEALDLAHACKASRAPRPV